MCWVKRSSHFLKAGIWQRQMRARVGQMPALTPSTLLSKREPNFRLALCKYAKSTCYIFGIGQDLMSRALTGEV